MATTTKKPAPKKPAAKPPAKKPVSKATPKPAAKKPLIKAVPKPAAKPTTKPATSGYVKRSPGQAAKDLQNYLKQKGVDLGSKAKPNVFIKAAQTDMGGVTADGIMGPKTRTRMETLLKSPTAKATAVSSAAKPVAATPIAAAASVAPPRPTDIGAALAVAKSPVISSTSDDEEELDDGRVESLPPPEPAPSVRAASSASIPPQVFIPSEPAGQVASSPKEQVIEALNSFAATPQATADDYEALIDALSAKFTPQIRLLANEVEAQALQRQATSEHNALMQADERWAKNNEVQQIIVDKLSELVKVLMANNSVSQRVYAAYGVHL